MSLELLYSIFPALDGIGANLFVLIPLAIMLGLLMMWDSKSAGRVYKRGVQRFRIPLLIVFFPLTWALVLEHDVDLIQRYWASLKLTFLIAPAIVMAGAVPFFVLFYQMSRAARDPEGEEETALASDEEESEEGMFVLHRWLTIPSFIVIMLFGGLHAFTLLLLYVGALVIEFAMFGVGTVARPSKTEGDRVEEILEENPDTLDEEVLFGEDPILDPTLGQRENEGQG